VASRWGLRTWFRVGCRMLVAGAFVACGNSGPASETTAPTCQPTGTSLTITAEDFAFDTYCLATLPNQAFEVTLFNRDSQAHNFLISTAFGPGSPIKFQGDPITGPGYTTYHISGLPAGTYSFECSLHPVRMHGTFVVEAASSASAPAPTPS